MSAVILLDSGPLGLLCNPQKHPSAIAVQQWLVQVKAQQRRVIIPEIADYEIRRELLRTQSTISLQMLDSYVCNLEYLPITTQAMRLAAELWANARQTGKPTGHDHALDGDVILAAQTINLGIPAVVATNNINHIARFTKADLWHNITT